MKNRSLNVSSANISVGMSYQVLNILMLIIVLRGMDPKFKKPIVWIIMGSFCLVMAISYIKKYTLTIDLAIAKNINKNTFKFRNPFVLWCTLSLFNKVNVNVSTLTGNYEYFFENNKIYIIQTNTPNVVDFLKDIILLLSILSILSICFAFLSKVDILRYGLAVVFCFTYTGIFAKKVLVRWCYSKMSIEFEETVRVSPFLYAEHRLATFLASGVILLSPQVLTFNEDTTKYIIEHELGHIKSFDYMKRIVVEICIFLLGLLFCYLQIVKPDISYLAFIPMIIIFSLQIPLVRSIELSADTSAATKLGVDFCIQALNNLNLHLKIEDKQLVEEVSLISGLVKIFQGSISFEDRINHLKSLSKLK
jgi:Zn-dependent protease with chaperone function